MAARQFSEIADGLSIFIDANVFIYHFSGPTALSPICSAFLKRIEDGAIRGLTSTVVLMEVLHRLMILEAAGAFQIPARDALRYLKEHPQQAKGLLAHQVTVPKIREMGVDVVVVGMEDILRSSEIKRQHGLLTNDAVLLAVMERSGVTALASNDPDFQAVGTITLYRPIPSA